jgi:citrate lyase subunit beta/citryl-CoA lyase
MTGCLGFVAPIFVPADQPERFEKAAMSGADAVILDLEDAVAGDRKAEARLMLRTDFTALPVIVRINACETPWHVEDLEAVSRLSPAAILVPKAERSPPFENLCRSIGRQLPLIALIETARGVADVREIAQSPEIVRLAFGSIDFCADLDCSHERDALASARSEIVLASRLGGKTAPLDGVTPTLDDPAVVLDDARYSRMLGFGGKFCIHPAQVSSVYAGFVPLPEELDWAFKVIAAGQGAVSVEGAMVDEPVRLRARNIIARCGAAASTTKIALAAGEMHR